MEDQTNNNEIETKDSKNTIIIILIAALAVALAGIAFLFFAYVLGNNNGSDPEEGGDVPPPVTVIIATNTPSAPEATLVPPTPEPEDPKAVVIARTGVNVRTGPGLAYPVLGTAPYLTELEITGVSQDGTWWVVAIPPNYNGGQGWVAEEYVEAQNADGALVVPAPPTPTPAATATATATPAPEIGVQCQSYYDQCWRIGNFKLVCRKHYGRLHVSSGRSF